MQLHVLFRPDIPFYAGADEPLLAHSTDHAHASQAVVSDAAPVLAGVVCIVNIGLSKAHTSVLKESTCLCSSMAMMAWAMPQTLSPQLQV